MEVDEKVKEEVKVKPKYFFNEEKDEMIKLFSVQSYSGQETLMQAYVIERLSKIKGIISIEQDKHGNILATKGVINTGEFYPSVIAHMDTVHDFEIGYKIRHGITASGNKLWAECKPRKLTGYLSSYNNYQYDEFTGSIGGYYYNGKTKRWELENKSKKNTPKMSISAGIGGDDGNGIWLALKMMEEKDVIKGVFTVQEETGAVGAKNLDLSFFSNVGYIIEGDRRGSKDIVTSIWQPICSDKFIADIEDLTDKFGFEEIKGMITDVSALTDNKVGVSCINLSVGYYNPHTFDEYIIAEEMFHTTQFVSEVIDKLGKTKYEHIYIPKTYYSKPATYGKYFSKYDDWYDDYKYDDYSDFKPVKSTPVRQCSCASELIDLDCPIHNPTVEIGDTNLFCECGTEVIEKEKTYYCPVCGKHFVTKN